MDNKQTAVEWLIEKNAEQGGILTPQDWIQAKEIEKQQIIKAYQDGRSDQQSKDGRFYNRNSKQYYNETYKK